MGLSNKCMEPDCRREWQWLTVREGRGRFGVPVVEGRCFTHGAASYLERHGGEVPGPSKVARMPIHPYVSQPGTRRDE